MEKNCQYIPYQQTGYFSKLIIDYLNEDEKLTSFYKHQVSINGFEQAIEQRNKTVNYRRLLVDVLTAQYKGFDLTDLQRQNLRNLISDNTFTITTAHQPNIFTGHLYFIYKILHTVKLAAELSGKMPENNFVPVFYMGSEDADLDELGHVNLDGEILEWKTSQTGAVGRMIVDQALVDLIDKMAGRLGVFAHGQEVIELLRNSYQAGQTIQQATFNLVNELFKEYGLLVLIPDNAGLKRPFNTIIKRELSEQFSHQLVEGTAKKMSKHYKVQASGRELNLFYLVDDKRERIEFSQDHFIVKNLQLEFTYDEIMDEVDNHPERFSPNVILRGVFQEMILPNIAFIGGGGELAYWLELKTVFEACDVPYPVLVLRNSFLLIRQSQIDKINKIGFTINDLFSSEQNLLDQLVKRESVAQLSLSNEINQLKEIYKQLEDLSSNVDVTLSDHVVSLQSKAVKAVVSLEKKMLRAEKKKFSSQKQQIGHIKAQLFPENNLQERVENFAEYYSRYGKGWILQLLDASQSTATNFSILTLD